MKRNFRHIGLAKLCGWFGISRQAFYQYSWEVTSTTLEEEMILFQVRHIRECHRRMGTRKLYEMLQPFLLEHQIKIGRDSLFDLLSQITYWYESESGEYRLPTHTIGFGSTQI
jgi:putative transposase